MANTVQLQLTVVSQEKQLLSVPVDSLTVDTAAGQVTILPGHIPLFSRINPGEIVYRTGHAEEALVVSRGFLDVGSNNQVVVMVDTGVLAKDINIEKTQAAIAAAHETMEKTQDQRELLLAEASLRQAMLEIRVAQKTKRTAI